MTLTHARGYFGIATWQMKGSENWGGIHRSAHAFGASFLCLIGHRFHRESTDTSKAHLHLPTYEYPDMEAFLASRPRGCVIVRVEVDGKHTLPTYRHQERAIYLFGGEDKTLPQDVGEQSLSIPSTYCLNLASAATVVMYDRAAKIGGNR